ALLPTVVEPKQLQAANSLVQSSQKLTQLAGTVVAGLVIRSWGSVIAMAFDALSFLPMIAALLGLEEPKKKPVPAGAVRAKTLHYIHEGLRAVRNDHPLLWMMLLFSITNLCVSGPIGVGLGVLAKFQFKSAAAFGTILTCFSVGTLAGSLIGGM